MATKTQIANLALLRIGITQALADVDTDDRPEAAAILTLWNIEREFVLREFPWPFSRKYATLSLASGSVSSPANSDWIYAYTYPTDCVFVRRIVDCAGRQQCSPAPFVIGRDPSGGLRWIFTNQTSAQAEYTFDMTDPAQFDESFTSMLSWRLAAQLALPFSRIENVAQMCLSAYAAELTIAKTRALAEAEYAVSSGDPDPRVRDIFNLALTRIGISRNVITADPELQFAQLWPRVCFDDERDYVLRDFPWPWATKYALLELIDGGTVATNRIDSAEDDWMYAYRYPSDCIAARRLVTELGLTETLPPPFAIGRDYEWENDTAVTLTLTAGDFSAGQNITITASATMFAAGDIGSAVRVVSGADTITLTITAFTSSTVVTGVNSTTAVPASLQAAAKTTWFLTYDGRIIWTNRADAKLQYTVQVTDPAEFDAACFSLLAWRLAALLAPSIAQTKNSTRIVDHCEQMYQFEKQRAQVMAANEGQNEEAHDAEWIRER